MRVAEVVRKLSNEISDIFAENNSFPQIQRISIGFYPQETKNNKFRVFSDFKGAVKFLLRTLSGQRAPTRIYLGLFAAKDYPYLPNEKIPISFKFRVEDMIKYDSYVSFDVLLISDKEENTLETNYISKISVHLLVKREVF